MNRRAWLVSWAAAMALVGMAVVAGAEVLGMHVAGALWRGLRVGWPILAQTGDVLGGLLGGALVGAAQWALLRPWKVRARWIAAAAAAGACVGLARVAYPPLALLVAPVAAGVASFVQVHLLPRPAVRWIRAQAIAAAWCALAAALPFSFAVAAVLVIAAAGLSAWGIEAALPAEQGRRSDGLAAPGLH